MLRVLTLPVRVTYRVGRRAGPVKVGIYGLGVLTGLLVAREPGRDLRERLRQQLEEARATAAASGDGASPAAEAGTGGRGAVAGVVDDGLRQ